VRVGRNTFNAETLDGFSQADQSDYDSRWQPAAIADVQAAGIGSSEIPLRIDE